MKEAPKTRLSYLSVLRTKINMPKNKSYQSVALIVQKTQLLCISAVFFLVSPLAQAQSLDDVLGVGKNELSDSRPETKQLWSELLKSLEQGNFSGAKTFAHQYTTVVDYTEPYQMNFASVALDVLNSNYDITATAEANFDENTKTAIAEVQAQVAAKERKVKALEDKKPELQKKVSNTNTTAAVFGALLGPQIGSIGNAEKENVENELKQLDKDIADLKSGIRLLEQKIPDLEEAGRRVIKEGRDKAFTLSKELFDGNHFREAIALSNTCIKKFGQDRDFVRLSQSAVDQQKTQNKAVAIAQAATKDATSLMTQNHLWEAKIEMEKSIASIKERVNDSSVLKFTEIELGRITRELVRKIEVALKGKDTILKAADRDATEASKKFADFLIKYPDYPDAEEDKIKLGDLKTKQVEAKFAKRLAAIEEVISNDPNEARAMIKRLIADNTDQDEVSVIKSRISKLEKGILQEEIKRIETKLNEAQSYLTKWNVTYAEELKNGIKPAASFTASLSGGTENLTRAISVQAGVVQQIDVLLTQPMDTVTKSQVVGLKSTAQAALDYMQGTKDQAASNKTVALVGGIVLGLVVLGGIIFLLTRKKKTTETKPAA